MRVCAKARFWNFPKLYRDVCFGCSASFSPSAGTGHSSRCFRLRTGLLSSTGERGRGTAGAAAARGTGGTCRHSGPGCASAIVYGPLSLCQGRPRGCWPQRCHRRWAVASASRRDRVCSADTRPPSPGTSAVRSLSSGAKGVPTRNPGTVGGFPWASRGWRRPGPR